ncbi:MAG: hypothetical protein DCF14_21625 [Phormidesmis priestleyi]|nr:MAG: hypothetical protein DCF14_21625 [Phormidesmis priestleyi]
MDRLLTGATVITMNPSREVLENAAICVMKSPDAIETEMPISILNMSRSETLWFKHHSIQIKLRHKCDS